VVLFSSRSAGTVMHSGKSAYEVGDYRPSWPTCDDAVHWEPFTGTIQLSND